MFPGRFQQPVLLPKNIVLPYSAVLVVDEKCDVLRRGLGIFVAFAENYLAFNRVRASGDSLKFQSRLVRDRLNRV